MHFYVHIPFCTQKCPYCKFALTPIFDTFKKKRYIEYLKKEIKEYFQDSPLIWDGHTLYLGWGTPSVLTPSEISDIFSVFPHFPTAFSEITLEANPEDISESYVRELIAIWINRFSLGIQTLNDDALKEISRWDKKSILNALSVFAKFDEMRNQKISLNVDFILGLPHVKRGEILSNLQEIHKKFPFISHTSVYILEDEKYPEHWKYISLTEGEMHEDFIEILEYFESQWWNHYELSNWAKPGFESRHNCGYWNHAQVRGFWLSASSFLDGVRFANASWFQAYYRGEKESFETLSDAQINLEKMMFWLRTDGWIVPVWTYQKLGKKVDELINSGWIEVRDGKIFLTKTWIFFIDSIMAELAVFV